MQNNQKKVRKHPRLMVEELEPRDMLAAVSIADGSIAFVNPPFTGVPLFGAGFPSDITLLPTDIANNGPALNHLVLQSNAVQAVFASQSALATTGVGQMTIATGANWGMDTSATVGYNTTRAGSGGPVVPPLIEEAPEVRTSVFV